MTGLTVAATWFDLGNWNLIVAMGIATFKGGAGGAILHASALRQSVQRHRAYRGTAVHGVFHRIDAAGYIPISAGYPGMAVGAAAVRLFTM